MTLGRQLFSVISVVFLVLLVGVQAIYLVHARHHLQQQLESHAQDAATSLGLSLGILLGRGDPALAETVIGAAFDRGHWQRIEFIDVHGRPVTVRELPASLTGEYPDWFTRALPLRGPLAESLVTTGWRQVGRVRVTSHPRFAYSQLWDTARDTLAWLLAIYLLALALLAGVLRGVLRPLTAVENAARAIGERRFVQVAERPGTRELTQVVAAMNSLSIKVRDALDAETARAERLQRAAYLDSLSGLLNRTGLRETFDSRFRLESEAFFGVLALVQVGQLAEINQTLGHERADELIRSIAAALAQCGTDSLAGRWTGGRFVLVLPESEAEDARGRLEALRLRLHAVVSEVGLADRATVTLAGVVSEAARPDFDALLAAADEALRRAPAGGPDGVQLMPFAPDESVGGSGARVEAVRNALRLGRLRFVAQEALSAADGAPLHLELMGRLLDDAGKDMAAADFMPLVTRHGLSQVLDRAVVQAVSGLLDATGGTLPVAVNLSGHSIADPAFASWLQILLRQAPVRSMRLIFEAGEHSVLQDVPAAGRFAEMVRAAGARFAIDHFGVHRDSLAMLRRMTPAYVKLSAVHTAKLAADAGTQFYVESVARAARQLDVPVIALGVEDGATRDMLVALGVSGYQGYIAGRPAPWPAV